MALEMTAASARSDNRLSHFNRERDAIVSEVEQRIVSRLQSAAREGEEHSLEYVLNEVAFAEIQRHEHESGRAAKKALGRWRDLAMRLNRMAPEAKRAELSGLVRHYVKDIVGNFNPRVYRFARSVLPPALSMLLHPVSNLKEGLAALGNPEGPVHVGGEIDHIHALLAKGTVIFAPTHSSNLDSLVVGLALERAGFPPVTYGAGKNLFSNPFISYFMYNLGAYRVDRRLRFGLYKNILKEYSTVLIERGFHSLFFPGGTRCRSNQVESKLKLGLLGTGLTAMENRARGGDKNFRVYVVPMTINYLLVLEAETLITDYLAETGRSRYIIEDDEFSELGRIVEFLRKILMHDSAVVVQYGKPVDVFGNAVDENGDSYTENGLAVDPLGYVEDQSGAITVDEQRDEIYTQGLGQTLVKAFRRNTIFLSTSLVCRAVYDELCLRAGTRDVYRLVRLPSSSLSVDRETIRGRVDRLRATIEANPAYGRLSEFVRPRSADELIDDAVDVLGKYHTKPVLLAADGRLRSGATKLIYYYQNRTAHIPEAA
jgi:glycerol-3-phosphate O-acyltransferase